MDLVTSPPKRMSKKTVIAAYFSKASATVKKQLQALDRLGLPTNDDQKTPELVSARQIEIIEKSYNPFAMLLYAYTSQWKPLLGPAFKALSLNAEERTQILCQLTSDGSDTEYPMLDLSRQELTRLPAEISKVPVLETNIGSKRVPVPYKEINLGYNPALRLKAADFDLLNRFEGIHFIALKLRPGSALSRLTHAVMLNFSLVEIRQLPPEIYELDRLRALKFNWTSVRQLSPKLSKLKNLGLIEASETPFAEAMRAVDDGDTSDSEAVATRQVLRTLRCRVEE